MQKNILIFLILVSTAFALDKWENNEPIPVEADWIQLVSGEWLQGEIKGLYDDKLEFDSDKLKFLTIDWEDVKQIKSKSFTSLNIEEQGILVGKLHMYEEYAVLESTDQNFSIKREKIISMTNGVESELNYWSGKLSFGYDTSNGNTKNINYTTRFNTKRQTADTRFKIDFIGNYSEAEDIKTEDNDRLSSSIDIFLTRRFFWRPAFVEYYKDSFQNIKAKYTYATGAGYDVLASSKTNWTVFAGPAYQTTKFENVEDGSDDRESTAAFILTSDYDVELTSRIDFILKYQAYFVNKSSGTYTHHTIATIETELINDFDLDWTFIWDRIQDPNKNSDGTLPERDDYKSIISIGYNY